MAAAKILLPEKKDFRIPIDQIPIHAANFKNVQLAVICLPLIYVRPADDVIKIGMIVWFEYRSPRQVVKFLQSPFPQRFSETFHKILLSHCRLSAVWCNRARNSFYGEECGEHCYMGWSVLVQREADELAGFECD